MVRFLYLRVLLRERCTKQVGFQTCFCTWPELKYLIRGRNLKKMRFAKIWLFFTDHSKRIHRSGLFTPKMPLFQALARIDFLKLCFTLGQWVLGGVPIRKVAILTTQRVPLLVLFQGIHCRLIDSEFISGAFSANIN